MQGLASVFYEFGMLYLMYADIIRLECFRTERIEIVWTVPSSRFDESHRRRVRVLNRHTQARVDTIRSMQWRKKKNQLSTRTINDSVFVSVYFLTLLLLWPLKLSYRDILIKAEKLYWCYCVAGYYCQCCRKLSVFLQFFTAETNQGQCLNCFTWKYCVER